MTARIKLLLPVFTLLGASLLLLGTYRSIATEQQPSILTLESIGRAIENSEPIISIYASEDERTLYLVSGLTGIEQPYSSNADGTFSALDKPTERETRGRRAYSALFEKEQVRVIGLQGNEISRFRSHSPVSHTFLNNGNLVIASPTDRHVLHLYSMNGQLLRSFGTPTKHKNVSAAENRFLNRGEVLADSAGNIYYVYNYAPSIQKFSPDGKLLYEVEVRGRAIDLQQELSQRFLNDKGTELVGGISIINAATIDRQTGHLWLAMNGSSDAGIVYEYNEQGEKLREYALQVSDPSVPPMMLTSVKGIAVTSSRLFAIGAQNQVYTFSRKESAQAQAARTKTRSPWSLLNFVPTAWAWSASNSASAAQTCGASQTWNACNFICPGPVCSNGTPTTTSSNGSTLACKDALVSALSPGYSVVSANCTQYPAGTTGPPAHLRGGCKSDVTICRDGVNSSHSVTLDCPAPSCETSGGGDPGGGGGGCLGSDCCGSALAECCAQDEWGCCNCSPILIDVTGDGFNLTEARDGVNFDLNGDGRANGVAWTAADSDDAWLALDRNGNGNIDGAAELFGNLTPQPFSARPNGFLALAEYDKPENGGNGDGVIDNRDSIFTSLRLWQDKNHNGLSEGHELHSLPSLNIVSLNLNYHESKQVDEHGNKFRYRGKVNDAKGAKAGRWAWDVFLVRVQ